MITEYIAVININDPFGDFVNNNFDFTHCSVTIASDNVIIPRKKDVTGSGIPKNLQDAITNPSRTQTGQTILITSSYFSYYLHD